MSGFRLHRNESSREIANPEYRHPGAVRIQSKYVRPQVAIIDSAEHLDSGSTEMTGSREIANPEYRHPGAARIQSKIDRPEGDNSERAEHLESGFAGTTGGSVN